MDSFIDEKGSKHPLDSVVGLDIIIANIGYKQYLAKVKHVEHLYNNILYAKKINTESVEISKSTYETLKEYLSRSQK